MGQQTNRTMEESYETLTRLARPGNWPRATEELADNTTFADGVLDERVVHYYHVHDSHVTSHGFTVYRGTDSADYQYYIVSSDLPNSWTALGCDSEEEIEQILQSFEDNPFLIES